MRMFADELWEGIGEAARKLAEARLAGDDYGAEAYRERLPHLRRVARCHGVDIPPPSGPAACGASTGDGGEVEAARRRWRG